MRTFFSNQSWRKGRLWSGWLCLVGLMLLLVIAALASAPAQAQDPATVLGDVTAQRQPEVTSVQIPATLGWYEIPNTKLRSVCAAEQGFSQVRGNTGCSAITGAWNSGIFDSTRNRLILFGGGHGDYYGNELYALDLDDFTMTRLNDPGLPIAAGCQEAIANGAQPNARHTYDGIEYLPNVDRLFVFGGSLSCGPGNFGRDTWTFSFQSMTWQKMNPSGPIPAAVPGVMTAYDPNTGKIFLHDGIAFFAYDFATDTYTRLGDGSYGMGYHLAATIDPVRKQFVIVGWSTGNAEGRVFTYDIAAGSTYVIQERNTTGDKAIIESAYPGLEYDPISDRIVAWDGGNTVYSLHLDTNQWTTTTFTGGPAALGNGTHGRWRYAPNHGVFVTYNSVDANGYTLRLTPAAADADFQARCHAPGVVKCWGFDNPATDLVLNTHIFAGASTTPSQDMAIKTSGAGALKFTLPPPPHGGANMAGKWEPQGTGLGASFGAGSSFYVQFRMRLSPEMLTNTWDSSWKFFELLYKDSQCGNTALVFVNNNMTGAVSGYTECGGRIIGVAGAGGGLTPPSPPYSIQQFDDGRTCDYPEWSTPNHPHCLYFKPDTWMTFGYKVDLGDLNQANGRIQGWYSDATITNTRFIDTGFTYPILGPSTGTVLNTANFSTYMTGLSANSGLSGVTASMWIDEFIISTQPIAMPGETVPPPGHSTPTPTPTSPPTNTPIGTATFAPTTPPVTQSKHIHLPLITNDQRATLSNALSTPTRPSATPTPAANFNDGSDTLQRGRAAPPDLPINTWVTRPVPPFASSIDAASKHVRLVYDTDRHLTYFWGGDYCVHNSTFPGRCASREYLWSYDPALDQWEMLIDENTPTAGFPRGRCLPGMAYDSRRKVLWMTSGSERFGSYADGLQSGGLWAFDPVARTWSKEGPAPDSGESTHVKVPNTLAEYMAYNPVADLLFVPSQPNVEFALDQVAIRDGVTNDHWATSAFSVSEPTFGYVSFALDTRRNRAIIYDPGDSWHVRGVTWSYDFATRTTTKLSEQILPARSVYGMAYDSTNDVVVMFAGYADLEGRPTAEPLNELWVLNLQTNIWSKAAIGGCIAPRKGESLVYDSHNNLFIQYGGTGGFQTGPDVCGEDGSELHLLRLDLGVTPPANATPPTATPTSPMPNSTVTSTPIGTATLVPTTPPVNQTQYLHLPLVVKGQGAASATPIPPTAIPSE